MVSKVDTGSTTQTNVVEQCICLLDAIHSNFDCQEFIATLRDLETKVLSNKYEDLVAFQLELRKIPQIPNSFFDTVNLRSTHKHPEQYSAAPMYSSINFRKESLLYTVNITNYQKVHPSLYDALENSNSGNSVHRLYIKHNHESLIEAKNNFNIILTLFLNACVEPCINKQLSHVITQTAAVHPLGEYHSLSTTAVTQSGFHGWIKVKIAKRGQINTIIPSELAGQVFNDQLSVHKLSTTKASTIDEAKLNETRRQLSHTIMEINTDSFSTVPDMKIENLLDNPPRQKQNLQSPKSTPKVSAIEPIVNTTSNMFQPSTKALRDMKEASIINNGKLSGDITGTDQIQTIHEIVSINYKLKIKSERSRNILSHGHRHGISSSKHLSTNPNKPPIAKLSPYISGRPHLFPTPSSISTINVKLEAIAAPAGMHTEAEVEQLGLSENHTAKPPRKLSIFEIDDSDDCIVEKKSSLAKPVSTVDVIKEDFVSQNHWETLEKFCMEQNVGIIQKDQLNIPYDSNVADAAGYFKKIYFTEKDQVAQIFVRSTASQKILEIIPLLKLKNSRHVGQIEEVIFDQEGPIGLTMHRYERTLESYLKKHKHQKLPAAQRYNIILQLLEAVQESHQAGIAHRDLSTVNFMINTKTEKDELDLYLIDFGKAIFTYPQVASDWWFSSFLSDDKPFTYEDEVIPATKEELTVWCKNLPMVMAKPDHGYPMYRSIQTLPRSNKDKNILPHLIDPFAEDIYSLGAIIWRVFSDMQPWPGVLDSSFKELRDACKSDYHIDKVLDRNIPGTKSKELLQLFLRVDPEDRKSIEYIKRWIRLEENKSTLLQEWSMDRKSKRGKVNDTRKESVSTTKTGKRGRQSKVPATAAAAEEGNTSSRTPSLSPQLEFAQHPLSRQSSQSSMSSVLIPPEQVYDTKGQKRKFSGDDYDPSKTKRRELDNRLNEKYFVL